MAKSISGTKMAAGIAAVAGVAAGYYFYGSKDAPKHRKIAAKWAGELKKEVVKEAKKLKRIERKAVAGVIDTVAEKYRRARSIDRKEIERATRELKDNWDKLAKEFNRQPMVRGAKKVAGSKAVIARKRIVKVVKQTKKMMA